MLQKDRKIEVFWYFLCSFGHSEELPSIFGVPILKKSLSLEPSKNSVVSWIRIQKIPRSTADSFADSLTFMGGHDHIFIMVC